MLGISADYTDYADYVCGSDVVREDQHAYPANMNLFAVACGAASKRNLRNLCNLRIFSFGFAQAALLALCLNNLRPR